MSKLTEYTAGTRFDSGDIIIKDGTNGTKKMAVKDAAVEFAGLVSAVHHRNVWRGKYLGTSVTAAQKKAIQDGTFDDLYIGDYWTIDGVNYRIADMDYWYNCGDTAFTKHHLVIVTEKCLYSGKMNETNITTGGYVGSAMYTSGLDSAKTKIKAAFGDMVLTHRDHLTNAVSNGMPSGGAWFDSSIELMNEIMVYGTHVFCPAGNGSSVPARYTTANSQLALFALNPRMIKTRETYWLRDVVSSANFAGVDDSGSAACYNASYSSGVRLVFPLG